MRLSKGIIEAFHHRITFSLPGELEVTQDPSCIWLSGENGVGKTTFIEGVLIPAFQKNKIPFLYFGQDFQTQYYTIQSVLAVEGNRIDPIDFEGTVAKWMDRGHEAHVLILDEFDKYWENMERLFEMSRSHIDTYLLVTHSSPPGKNGPGEGYRNRVWSFKSVTQAAGDPFVEIRETIP